MQEVEYYKMLTGSEICDVDGLIFGLNEKIQNNIKQKKYSFTLDPLDHFINNQF